MSAKRWNPGSDRASIRLRLLLAGLLTLGALTFLPAARAQAACTPITFGAAPTSASISAGSETDCYTYSGAIGDRIRVRVVETTGTITLLHNTQRPSLTTVCTDTSATESTCTLDATGTHTINVRDSAGTNTGNYSIAIQKLNNPTGCTALTFGAAPTAKTATGAGQMDCYSFTGAVGDRIRVRVVRTSGTYSPMQEVVRPDGSTVCFPTTSVDVTCVLTSAGTHRVIVRDNVGTNTGAYVVTAQKLNGPTGCTTLAYGAAPTTASLSTAGELDCYTLTGVAAGDQIRVRIIETSGTAIAIQEFIGPAGDSVCSVSGAVETTCQAEDPGTQRIIVEDNNGTNTGNYSISVQKLNGPTGCTPLSVGAAPTAKSITTAGQTDCFTVTGVTSGDRLRIRLIRTNGTLSPLQEVVRPNGTTLCSPTTAQELTCVADTTGTHRILVRDNVGTNPGDYVIAIQKLNAPAGCTPLTYGAAPLSASISAAGETDCYTIAGSAGDQIRFRAIETSGTLTALVDAVRPTGAVQCGATAAQEMSCTLTVSGTYTLFLRDNNGTNTGTYNLVVQRLNNPTGCTTLTYGAAPVSRSITAAGQWDCFTVAGMAAGDRVRVRIVRTVGTLSPLREVVRPNGSTMCFSTTAQDATCTTDVAGTHRILVRDNVGTNTGDYVISIQKLNGPTGCTTLTYGAAPITRSVTGPGQMDCFTLAGVVAGDTMRVRVVETNGALTASQEITRADGGTLCGPTTALEITCQADSAGSHRIIVRDNNGLNTGDYVISVQKLNGPTGCTTLAYGAAPVAKSITTAGQMDCFTVTPVTASDRLRVRVYRTNGTLSPLTEVIAPGGATQCFPTTIQELNCDADTTGTHRVVVRDNIGTNTGDYVISVQKLNAPTGCTTLTYGAAPTAASISTAGEMDCYTIAGTAAGDQVRIRVIETSGAATAVQELTAPDGTTQCGPTSAAEVTCALDVGGTQRVLIRDNTGTITGNYSIAIQKLNGPTGCTTLTYGAAPTAAGIADGTEMDCYTVTGVNAGDRLRFRTVRTTGTTSLQQEVIRPNGTTMCFATSSQDVTCQADTTGTYRLVVRDSSGTGTGNYVTSAQKLNAPTGCTALTIGAGAIVGNLTTAGEQDCFTVVATAGQPLTVTVLETGGETALQEMVRPSGSTICGPTTASAMSCTAGGAGTYTILVRDNAGPTTGGYTIKVASP